MSKIYYKPHDVVTFTLYTTHTKSARRFYFTSDGFIRAVNPLNQYVQQNLYVMININKKSETVKKRE